MGTGASASKYATPETTQPDSTVGKAVTTDKGAETATPALKVSQPSAPTTTDPPKLTLQGYTDLTELKPVDDAGEASTKTGHFADTSITEDDIKDHSAGDFEQFQKQMKQRASKGAKGTIYIPHHNSIASLPGQIYE